MIASASWLHRTAALSPDAKETAMQEPIHVYLGYTRCNCIAERVTEELDILGKPTKESKAKFSQMKARWATVRRVKAATADKLLLGCKLCLTVSSCAQHPSPLFADLEQGARA